MGGSAAAHGGEKGDFVAGAKTGIPGGKFLVARSDYRRTILCKIGMASGVEGEKLLDGSGVGELKGILCVTGEFLKAAEE